MDKEENSGDNEGRYDKSSNRFANLDEVDAKWTKSKRISMENMIPMTETSYGKDAPSKSLENGDEARQMEPSNIATEGLLESADKTASNINHRVSSSSSSPTTADVSPMPKTQALLQGIASFRHIFEGVTIYYAKG